MLISIDRPAFRWLPSVDLPIDDHQTLRIETVQGRGDVCCCFHGSLTDSSPKATTGEPKTTWEFLLEDEDTKVTPVFVKVANVATLDNALLDNEVEKLTQLYPTDKKDEKFWRYLPKHYAHLDVDGRHAHVMTLADGYLSLERVIREYPEGVDYRDAAWMLKRCLAAVGFAHEQGIVHGAMLPPHLLVHPTGHGAKIVDWCYATAKGGILSFIPGRFREFYPSEVLDRKRVTATTDIFLLGMSFIQLLGGDLTTKELPDRVPEPIRKLLTEMTAPQPTMRPGSAWDLHEEFDHIMVALVGKAKYRPLPIPPEVYDP